MTKKFKASVSNTMIGKSSIGKSSIGKSPKMFNASIKQIVGEMLQNARRAAESQVTIDTVNLESGTKIAIA